MYTIISSISVNITYLASALVDVVCSFDLFGCLFGHVFCWFCLVCLPVQQIRIKILMQKGSISHAFTLKWFTSC